MKLKNIGIISLLSILGSSTVLHGQTVATDPVGFYTVNVNANSDRVLALGLSRGPVLTTTVASVSDNVVTLNATLTPDQFVFNEGDQNNTYYLQVKGADGAPAVGKWFEVTDNDASTVTLDQGASANTVAAQGLDAGAQVCIIPFWTLNTLFPNGEGLDATSDFFDPADVVRLYTGAEGLGVNVPTGAAIFYYDGSQGGSAGWYNQDTLAGPLDNLPIAPDSVVTVRNEGEASSLTITGAVPTDSVSSELVTAGATRNDNVVGNPFPVPTSLGSNGLRLFESGAVASSSDFFNPVETVRLYDADAEGTNVPPSGIYLYYDGSQGGTAGWYNADTFAGPLDNDLLVNPGDAIVVRKAAGVDGVVDWTVNTPYND